MSDFTFTDTVECDSCGKILSSSDDDCDYCSNRDIRTYHFNHMFEDRTEVTQSIDPIRAWHDLMEKVDEPLPWRCEETGDMTLHIAQMGIDVKELHKE